MVAKPGRPAPMEAGKLRCRWREASCTNPTFGHAEDSELNKASSDCCMVCNRQWQGYKQPEGQLAQGGGGLLLGNRFQALASGPGGKGGPLLPGLQ